MAGDPIRPRGEMPEVPKATTITAHTVRLAFVYNDWRSEEED